MNPYAECLGKRLEQKSPDRAVLQTARRGGGFLQENRVPDSAHPRRRLRLIQEQPGQPSAMVKVLTYDLFQSGLESLPEHAFRRRMDGTLLDRFRGTDLRGRVFGKTGFVNGVRCLSGYLTPKTANGTRSACSQRSADKPRPASKRSKTGRMRHGHRR